MLQIASLRDSISLQKSLNVKEKQESEDNQGAIEKKLKFCNVDCLKDSEETFLNKKAVSNAMNNFFVQLVTS